MNIIPAIIGRDFEEVREKIELVPETAKWIQIDVSDGLFTPVETWPYYENEDSPLDLDLADFVRTDVLKTEIHLMVENPAKVLDKWLSTGADRILVHYEATDRISLKEVIERVKDAEVEVGIVLKMETPITVLNEFIEDIDLVQLMSINKIGAYGEPFDGGVLDKVKSLRAKYPGVTISLDGGINQSNIKKISEAGVANAVVGSAVFGKDETGELEDFDEEKIEVGKAVKRIKNLG